MMINNKEESVNAPHSNEVEEISPKDNDKQYYDLYLLKHPLNTGWTLWYHSLDNNDWSLQSYQEIININFVEEFWMTFNKINDFSNGMFFLMRKNHLPIWESYDQPIHFVKYRTSKKQFAPQWLNLCKALIGETATVAHSQAVGASLSPKFKNMIIRLWTFETTLPQINPKLELSSESPPLFE